MDIRHSETARESLPRDARGRFVAVPRPPRQRRRPGLSVDPLWIVAGSLLLAIACLDYGAIVKSPAVIAVGVVAAIVGVGVMRETERE